MTRAHVVVVNDDLVQMTQVAAVLKGAGHRVSAFQDAAKALAELSDGADGADVRLFVVDLHMPGIDGWKLCRLLRSSEFGRFNETPILVVSATFTGADVESITTDLGADAFMEAPFDAEALLERVDSLLAGEVPRVRQRALIVDDDPAVRTMLARAFTNQGYEVVEAGGAAEARRVWTTRHVDVVLLDFHLPDGSCEALIREWKDPANRTSILVMTGDPDPALPVRLLGQGADGYLRKPFQGSFAVELARVAARQRALLRIESILEARTQELRASELRYRGLFETIPDLVMVLDHDGRLAEINPEGLAILGRSEADVLARPILEVAHPDQAPALGRWLSRLAARGGDASLETELLGAGGDALAVEMTGRTVELRGAPALLLVGRDLTERRKAEAERRRLEAQMQHAQRLESLGVLAGGVAHDFNNLLVGILGNASLALLDLPEQSPVRESIDQIELAARRAAELTQQILAFAGKSKVAALDIHLPELIREMGQLVEPAVSKKARVSYSLPGNLPTIRGDAGQLRQVVMNLIINASDALAAMPGDIVVSASVLTLPREHDFLAVDGARPEPGQWIALEVSDTGAGMDPDTMSRIFEPFFTTKFAGGGLGLASTLGIVRAHHGFIRVDSTLGVGTRMMVLFPPHGARKRRLPAEERSPLPQLSGPGTILVVDDEPQVRALTQAVLLRRGFEVVLAEDGVEALELAHRRVPDGVVMDVSMPRMDGIECLERLRASYPDLPVVLSSGYPPEGIVGTALVPSATGFLKKPYGAADLMNALRDVMCATRPTGELVG